MTFRNFIEETCTGTGSTITLTGATAASRQFQDIYTNGEQFSYVIEDANGINVVGGTGTWNTGNTITRNDSFHFDGAGYDPSPTGNLTLSAGTHTIRVTPLAKDMNNWDTAFSWGDHSGIYLPLTGGSLSGNLLMGTDRITFDSNWEFYNGGTANRITLTQNSTGGAEFTFLGDGANYLNASMEIAGNTVYHAGNLTAATLGALTAESDTLATVTARGATTGDLLTFTQASSPQFDFTATGGPLGFKWSAGKATTAQAQLVYRTTPETVSFERVSDSASMLTLNTSDLNFALQGGTIGGASINSTLIGQWNTAYGWGDHSLAGYLTSFSEADTLDTVTGRGNTTTNSITVGDLLVEANQTALHRSEIRNTATTGNRQTDLHINAQAGEDVYFGVNYGGAAGAFIDNRTTGNLSFRDGGTIVAYLTPAGVFSTDSHITTGTGTNDTYIRAYHSDNTYTELRGYGLQFQRSTSYIRPTSAGQVLHFGNDSSQTQIWGTINIDSDATIVTSDISTNPVMTVTGNYDTGRQDTLLVKSNFDRDAGVGIATSIRQWNIWVDGAGDDYLQVTNDSLGTVVPILELAVNGRSHIRGQNQPDPFGIIRRNPTSDQVSMAFQATSTRFLGKGTDHEPYWHTAAAISSGSMIVTESNSPTLSGLVSISNANFDIASYIRHIGDTNTYFGFNTTDSIYSVTGGSSRLLINNDGVSAYSEYKIFASSNNTPAESILVNPTYNHGTETDVLFDATEYWDNYRTRLLAPNEGGSSVVVSDYSRRTDTPSAGGAVMEFSTYENFYSDYIPVTPGDIIYGEQWVQYVSGTGGVHYFGFEQYDKDKNPITSNQGTTYAVASNVNHTSTSWTKQSGTLTIPSSHTIYNGSDGGGIYFIRVRILMNYNAGGALRRFSAPIVKRLNQRGDLIQDGTIEGTEYTATANTTSSGAPTDGAVFNGFGVLGNRSGSNPVYVSNENGGVYLNYSGGHNTNTKLNTTSTGINVTGVITASGNINANGSIVGDGATDITGIDGIVADRIEFDTGGNVNIDTYQQEFMWNSEFAATNAGTVPSTYCVITNFGGNITSKGMQLAAHYGTNNNGFYIRRRSDNAGSENGANVWQNWKQIMTKEYADTLYEASGDYAVLNSTGTNTNDYLHIARSSTGAVAYFNNTSTGDIARFVNNATTSYTGVAGGNSGQFTVLNSGGIDVGDDSNFRGVITGGDASSTAGGLVLQQRYTGNDILLNIGSNYSSGAPYIAYGLQSSQSATSTWLSTYDNFAGDRGILSVSSELQFLSKTGDSTIVGSAVTGLQENFLVTATGDLYARTNIHFNGALEDSGTSNTIYRSDDTWLRLNPDGDFTSGIYCTATGVLRHDGWIEAGLGLRHVADDDNRIVFGTDTQSFNTAGVTRLAITNTSITSSLNHDFSAGIDVTGNITATGTTHSVGGFLANYTAATESPLLVLNAATTYGLFHTEGTNDTFQFKFAGTATHTFNQTGTFTSTGTVITPDIDIGSLTLSESTHRAGLLFVQDTTTTWAGVMISNAADSELWSFMADGAVCGLYNDTDNQWYYQCQSSGAINLYHAGSSRFATTSAGGTLTGSLTVSNQVIADDIVLNPDTTTDTWGLRLESSNATSNDSGFYSQGSDWTLILRNSAGTIQCHLKPDAQSIFNSGLDVAGTVDINGSVIANDYRATGGAMLKHYNSGWTTTVQSAVYAGYQANTGDYIYIKAPGNSNDQGILAVGDTGLWYGDTNDQAGGGLANDAINPFSNNSGGIKFRVDSSGYIHANRLYIGNPGSTASTEYIYKPFTNIIRFDTNNAQRAIVDNGGFDVTGAITATGDITAYSSDERLKDGKPIQNAMNMVNQWKAIRYTWNDKAKILNESFDHDRVELGLSAQSVAKTAPELTTLAPFDDDNEGRSISGENYLTINYARAVSVLTAALQEKDAEIQQMKSEIAEIKEMLYGNRS